MSAFAVELSITEVPSAKPAKKSATSAKTVQDYAAFSKLEEAAKARAQKLWEAFVQKREQVMRQADRAVANGMITHLMDELYAKERAERKAYHKAIADKKIGKRVLEHVGPVDPYIGLAGGVSWEKRSILLPQVHEGIVAPPQDIMRGTLLDLDNEAIIPGRTVLTDVDRLVPSHDPITLRPRHDYPAAALRWARHSHTGEDQLARLVYNFRPMELYHRPMIVHSGTGIVLSGSRRLMALARTAEKSEGDNYYEKLLRENAKVIHMDVDQLAGRYRRPIYVIAIELAPEAIPSFIRRVNQLQDRAEETALFRLRRTQPKAQYYDLPFWLSEV